jgi:hypothetical protein
MMIRTSYGKIVIVIVVKVSDDDVGGVGGNG